VTQSDFFFTPRAVVVHTGDSLRIANISNSPHTFTIASKGIDVVNSPGQAKTITIQLKAGSYPFVCTFHQSLGMTGTLIVSAPGTKPPAAAVAAAAASPSPGSSPGASGPAGTAPGTASSSPAGALPPQAAAGGAGDASSQAGGGGFPLGTLVILGGLLSLAAGVASLALNFRNRARARSG
jgi:hypothetical protein